MGWGGGWVGWGVGWVEGELGRGRGVGEPLMGGADLP